MNQDLGTTTYGNRIHRTNRAPMEGVKLGLSLGEQRAVKNPRNDLKESMKGMGKDSDRTERRAWKG